MVPQCGRALRPVLAAGTLTDAVDPDLLNFLLLSLGGYWAAVPQVVRMITEAAGDGAGTEDARRRACVVEAARRLAGPIQSPSAPGRADC